MKQIFISYIILLLILISQGIKIKNRALSEFNIHNAQIAIDRIKSRVYTLTDDTSCRVAAKFILLTAANVKTKKDMKILKLSESMNQTLNIMKSLLRNGYMLQVETLTNHHFILFMKNNTELYLLQAFYKFYRLEDWMASNIAMKPMYTLKEFFDKFAMALDPATPKEMVNKLILELFYPDFISKNNTEKQTKMIDYFKGKLSLVKVNFVPYDFSIKEDKDAFYKIFHQVDGKFFV